jgi:hypothetical protein
MTEDGISLEEALIWLREPIINNCEAFFDDFIDTNAKFRNDVGLKTTLTRTAEANCCSWCSALAGTYEYGKAPDDIYRRHEFCRCTVTYQSEKQSQNVWTKRIWKSTPEELAARQQAGKQPERTAAEIIEAANNLYKDKVVSQIMESLKDREGNQWQGDRKKALRKYANLTPEQRIELLRQYEEKREQGRR